MDIGQYNDIPDGAIRPWPHGEPGPVVIGDCNTVHEGVRILVGPGGFRMGDYNVIHNNCFLGGPGPLGIGHNCWIGQRSVLDSTGGLQLGNGVTVGYQCHVWSHVARGEQIEGWRNERQQTVLGDDVWLVGDTVTVNPGVRMGRGSAVLAHSVVTHDTYMGIVYAGVPACAVPNVDLWRGTSRIDKLELLWQWAQEFCCGKDFYTTYRDLARVLIVDDTNTTALMFQDFKYYGWSTNPDQTYFDLRSKQYTKRLTKVEREFMRFLRGKAHFVPCDPTA